MLKTFPTDKTLSYQAEYDGIVTPITESWQYGVGTSGSTITAPDGGVTTEGHGSTAYPNPVSGLNFITIRPDGTVVEHVWRENIPCAPCGARTDVGINHFIKSDFTTVKDALGNLSQTAIRDYSYDKNGNITQVKEYDWVPYSSLTRDANGDLTIPPGAPLKRVTTNTYSRPTPDSSDSNSNTLDCYWNSTSPNLKNAIASGEVSDGASTLARTEFSYDDPTTTGNLIQKTSWDSTKGAYSSPLPTANSISTYSQYNQYGSPTQTTDARGTLTVIAYGPVGGVIDLYPTQIQTAYGTSIQRTETRVYDFSTGLVTSATDADNNVTTSMDYDVFGRPKLQKTAVGKSEETRTRTDYEDTLRRVIVYSDLNTLGDEKLVAIQHYDQLGRVRLARQLEDSTTQSATDETAGIKVQTRYLFSGANSYTLSSNPYRASTSGASSAEGTMGWTRSQSDNSGRVVEVQTFGGSSLPAPWGSSTTSTGTVTTAYDANFTTVTDQANEVRRSMTNGLGQLARVDEPDSGGNLGATDNPVQPTSYVYDTLGNLATVNQGSQTRNFVYSSLARLLTATNPESGTISYQYDENGNLTQKTDSRSITTTYVYDVLNRNTTVNYSDSTPAVTRTFDNPTSGAYGIGRLWKTETSGSNRSRTTIDSFDALGRPLTEQQQFYYNNTWSQSYSVSNVNYDRAGHILSETYPSGRIISNTFDNAGRLSVFSGTLGDGTNRTYATGIIYDAASRMTKEQFGTSMPIFNKLFYNSRGQLSEIRESTSYTGPTDTNWNRGAILNQYSTQCSGPSCNGTDNNGNLRKQEHWIPDGNGNVSAIPTQQFDYDSLNRLQRVYEGTTWQQQYSYDRWGNRTINNNSNATWGDGINNVVATIDTNTNRLLATNDPNHTLIDYDPAGNQTKDYLTSNGTRAYDAENRLVVAVNAANQTSVYSYDGDGKRVRRNIAGVETWQIYGLGGELIAEYPQNGSATTPQKEYGYRNGQLLVTLTAGSGTPPTFTDNPLVTGSTVIKAVHLTELRDAVNQARSRAGLAAATWTDATLSGVAIKAVHITELRTKLDEARAALGLSAASYTDSTLAGVAAKAVHITELRACVAETVTAPDIRWLVPDQLGTPRMIFDQSGSLANVSRHDYLPFGEELFAGQGGRTQAQGYTLSDNVRQKFTGQQRDDETGLDYFLARYYASTQGRFTSADPAAIKQKHIINPQDLNRYAYVGDNPLSHVDKDGKEKVKVVIETFIPFPDVTVWGRTFRGDFDDKGKRVEGRYRTQLVIIVETDPSKNRGSVLYGALKSTGVTVELDKPGGKPKAEKKASGDTLQPSVSRDQYGVHIEASGNESNPLRTSPGITGEYSVHLQSEGPGGRLRVGYLVDHDSFPSHRITITREESGNTTTEVYLFDPRTNEDSPYSLFPGVSSERHAAVKFIEPKKPQ